MKRAYIILLLLLAVSCVPKSKYTDLQNELSNKESEIAELEDKASRLQSRLDDCQTEYDDLYSTYSALRNRYNDVIDDFNNLVNDYNSLSSFRRSTSSFNSSSVQTNSSGRQGCVVYEGKSDYYIIQTQQFYVLLETYTGWLSKGDIVSGDLHSYGFKDVLKNGSSSIRVYIENYWSNINKCYDWLRDHDKLK